MPAAGDLDQRITADSGAAGRVRSPSCSKGSSPSSLSRRDQVTPETTAVGLSPRSLLGVNSTPLRQPRPSAPRCTGCRGLAGGRSSRLTVGCSCEFPRHAVSVRVHRSTTGHYSGNRRRRFPIGSPRLLAAGTPGLVSGPEAESSRLRDWTNRECLVAVQRDRHAPPSARKAPRWLRPASSGLSSRSV